MIESVTTVPGFDGATYDHERDHARLSTQFIAVRDLMIDGHWRTLEEIGGLVSAPTHSVSARLRDMRKKKFGSYVVERRYLGGGLHDYRVVIS